MNILTKELQEGIASNPFRVGQIYTRKIVYSICNPGKIWDKGGNWSTGYATAGKKFADVSLRLTSTKRQQIITLY